MRWIRWSRRGAIRRREEKSRENCIPHDISARVGDGGVEMVEGCTCLDVVHATAVAGSWRRVDLIEGAFRLLGKRL